LNIQKDLLHIETDETWEMPVIQSVTSVKQEAAEEEEQGEKLPIVKLEPGLSKNLKRIESEILAEAAKKENVRRKKEEPELLLDPATGTMRKAGGKRRSNDTTLKVPEKTVRKSRPEADMKYITQKVKLKKGKREPGKTGTSDEESESERSVRKSGTQVDEKYITEKVKLKKGKIDNKRSNSEESEKEGRKISSEVDTKCITKKVKLKTGKVTKASEGVE